MTVTFSYPAGASSAQAQLKTKALSISDLPTGWRVDNSSSGGVANATGCFSKVQSFSHAKAVGVTRVEVSYTDGNFPSLDETLEVSRQAAKHYAAVVNFLNSCRQVSLNANNITFTGSVGAMSFPTVVRDQRTPSRCS